MTGEWFACRPIGHGVVVMDDPWGDWADLDDEVPTEIDGQFRYGRVIGHTGTGSAVIHLPHLTRESTGFATGDEVAS